MKMKNDSLKCELHPNGGHAFYYDKDHHIAIRYCFVCGRLLAERHCTDIRRLIEADLI